MKRLWKIMIPVAIVLLWSMTARVQTADPSAAFAPFNSKKLVESRRCQICHQRDDAGNQWGVWLKGPHAKAFESLGTDKAKEVAAKLGIKDPQTSGACLKCHSTAHAFSEELASKLVPVNSGVTCQSCHGPGADYVMKHRTDVAGAYEKLGMIKPTAANTCMRCHNEENPTYDPNRYTLPSGEKVDFDFEQAAKKIAHPK